MTQKMIKDFTPVYYAKFQSPVPALLNKEPVYEFSIRNKEEIRLNKADKYLVDQMLYHRDGLIFKCGDETNIIPLANVAYVRL